MRLRYNYKISDLQTKIVSFSIFLYFISIFLMYDKVGEQLGHLPYQIVSCICIIEFFILRIVNKNFKCNIYVVFFIFLCILTGIINNFIINNIGFLNILECAFFNTTIAYLILERRIDTVWLERALYLSITIFSFEFIQSGFGVRIGHYSNNQVAAVLLIQLTVYYVLKDYYNEKITVLPALLTWVLSLVVRGRSGIIVCSLLLLIVLVAYMREQNRLISGNNHIQARTFVIALLGAVVFIGVAYIAYILKLEQYYDDIMFKFTKMGLDDSGRAIMWEEYFSVMMSSFKFFMLGVPKADLIIGRVFGGITHNSFINIHADNGMLMLLFCLGLIFNAIKLAIKTKHYIYLMCMLLFFLRSSFDSVFWGNAGTTTFMILLFTPLVLNDRLGRG